MRLLLSCDERVYYYNSTYYVRTFGLTLFKRYLTVYSELTIVARVENIIKSDTSKYVPLPEKNIKIIPVSNFRGPFDFLKKMPSVLRVTRTRNLDYDVGIFRVPSTTAFLVARTFLYNKKTFGLEIVANPLDLMRTTNNLLSKFAYYMWHLFLKLLCKKAACISYVTKHSLQKVYVPKKQQYTISYSSVELNENFYYKPRSLNITKDSFRLLHIAHPIKTCHKGHIEAIDILKYVKYKLKLRVKLYFGGDGDYVAYLMQYARDKGVADDIVFLGFLTEQEVMMHMLASDIFLFPSYSEGLPRVIIEALASGLPCVTSNVGGLPELVQDELLFNLKDLNKAGYSIFKLLTDSIFYSEISKENYYKSLEYQNDILNKKRKSFYTYLLSRR